jgi:hypothetical protein
LQLPFPGGIYIIDEKRIEPRNQYGLRGLLIDAHDRAHIPVGVPADAKTDAVQHGSQITAGIHQMGEFRDAGQLAFGFGHRKVQSAGSLNSAMKDSKKILDFLRFISVSVKNNDQDRRD